MERCRGWADPSTVPGSGAEAIERTLIFLRDSPSRYTCPDQPQTECPMTSSFRQRVYQGEQTGNPELAFPVLAPSRADPCIDESSTSRSCGNVAAPGQIPTGGYKRWRPCVPAC